MSDASPQPDQQTRAAVDALASAPVDELRRLAHQLDTEAKLVKALLKERCRQPERGHLALVGGADA